MLSRNVILSYIEGTKLDIGELKKKREEFTTKIINKEDELISYVKQYMSLFNLEDRIIREKNEEEVFVIVGIMLVKGVIYDRKDFLIIPFKTYLSTDWSEVTRLTEDEMLKFKKVEEEE